MAALKNIIGFKPCLKILIELDCIARKKISTKTHENISD